MDIVIERGALRDAAASEYRNKAILLDVTYTYAQAVDLTRAASAGRDGSVASKSEACKRSHYAQPGQVSFDERSYISPPSRCKALGGLERKAAT